jgi:hypothetical protein
MTWRAVSGRPYKTEEEGNDDIIGRMIGAGGDLDAGAIGFYGYTRPGSVILAVHVANFVADERRHTAASLVAHAVASTAPFGQLLRQRIAAGKTVYASFDGQLCAATAAARRGGQVKVAPAAGAPAGLPADALRSPAEMILNTGTGTAGGGGSGSRTAVIRLRARLGPGVSLMCSHKAGCCQLYARYPC